MAYQLSDFIREANDIFSEIEKELLNRKKGIRGDGTIQQLEFIRDELEQIKNFAFTNNLPPKECRYTAFSRYVVDEWDVKSILGQRLCELADKFKRKL